MKIEVISPHGFCAGVERAVRMANEALSDGVPLCCLHEIVHNESVVKELEGKGVRFVDDVDDVPSGSAAIISAHGTSPDVFGKAAERGIRIIDATCPFVAAGHAKIRANFAQGMRTVIMGSPDHAEVRGYLGEPGACLPADVKPGEKTGRIVQTTLDSGKHEGVCSATRDRQQAVRRFVEGCRGESPAGVGVLVVGSPKSANTARLAEIARQSGAKSWRVSTTEDVEEIDFRGTEILGVTSGASTPESTLQTIVAFLRGVKYFSCV